MSYTVLCLAYFVHFKNKCLFQVARFIREQTETSFQCIVISLKEEFYGHADSLVGIVPDVSVAFFSM